MKQAQPFGLDDVTYAFKHQLACRHVSDEASYQKHFSSAVNGDAYAIGAAHVLTYTPQERAHDDTLNDAMMNRAIEAMTAKGPSDLDAVKAGGAQLVSAYKAEIRKMVSQAVDYDDRHSDATECHFVFYKDLPSVVSPYDVNRYPFGKCGKGNLNPEKTCGGVFLEEGEKESLRGNPEAVKALLTEKVLAQIQAIRARGESRGGAGTAPIR